MATLSRDTHENSEKVQISLLRKASVATRFALVRSLTTTAIQLSRRAIRRANPNASERELSILFVKLHYGEDLGERVRRYLERRDKH